MKIATGDVLLSRNGDRYRVIESREGIVSLMRVEGYTLFSCSEKLVSSMFNLAGSHSLTQENFL